MRNSLVFVSLSAATGLLMLSLQCQEPQNPYTNPENATGTLRLYTAGGGDVDTVGNPVRIGCSFFLGNLIDSAIVTVWSDTAALPDTEYVLTALPEERDKEISIAHPFSSPGVKEVELRIFRGNGSEVAYRARLTILPCTKLTVVEAPGSEITVQEGEALRLTVTATGPPSLSYAWYHNGQAIPGAEDSLLLVSRAGAEHAGEYRCRIEDGSGDSLWTPLTRVIVSAAADTNHHPHFLPDCPAPSYRLDEQGTLTLCVGGADTDGDSVELWVDSGSTVPGIAPGRLDSGEHQWALAGVAEGSYVLQLRATDGKDTIGRSVTVVAGGMNLPPSIAVVGQSCGDTVAVREGTALSLTVLATDQDTGDSIVLMLEGVSWDTAMHGMPSFDPGTGTLFYEPSFTVASRGTPRTVLPVRITAHDDAATPGYDTCMLYLAVGDSNRVPVARDGAAVTQEDSTVAVGLEGSDPDGDDLTFIIKAGPDSGTLTGTPPSLTYAPDDGFSGRDSIVFVVSDGVDTSTPGLILITVGAENDPPSVVETALITEEDTRATVTLDVVDPDGDSAWCVVGTPPFHGVALCEGKQLSYIPAADYHGPDSVGVRPFDGTEYGVEVFIRIDVNGVNDRPVVRDTSVATDQEVAVTIIVPARDADGDVLEAAIIEGPDSGSVAVDGLRITYTPSTGFVGEDRFTWSATDGELQSEAGEVVIRVDDVPEPPVVSIVAPAEGARYRTGDQVELAVSVSDPDDDLARVEYYRNAALIAAATEAPYSHTHSAVEGVGQQFWAVAHDSAGNTATSATVVIDVLTPPEITSGPSDVIVLEGRTFELSVSATGTDLRYQWYRNDTEIPEATSPSYTKAARTGDHDGVYYCTVSNEAETVRSAVARVSLQYELTVNVTGEGSVAVPSGGTAIVDHGVPCTVGVETAVGSALSSWSTSDSGVAVENRFADTTTVTLTGGHAVVTAKLTGGIIAHWCFDEGSGSVAYDQSGNAHDGAIRGANWVQGIRGYALEFDTVNQQVEVPSHESFTGMSQLTLEAWVRPNPPDYGIFVVAKWGAGSSEDDSYDLRMFGEKWGAEIAGGTQDEDKQECSVSLAPQEWAHLCAVYTGDSLKLYTNGVLCYGEPSFSAPIRSTECPLFIGDGEYSADTFHGLIDEVRILDRALAPEEVAERYESFMVTGQ